MFDMSWGEIMVIGGVALIVIGPKDLPKALRTVGQMTTKVRRMAGEFQSQFSEAMREAELQDVRKEVEGLNRDVSSATAAAFNPIQTLRDEIKGAVDVRPAAAAQPDMWGTNPGPAAPGPEMLLPGASEPFPHPPLEAAGPVPPAAFEVPDSLPPDAAFPETQPLVPLPLDEPSRPAEPGDGGVRARDAVP